MLGTRAAAGPDAQSALLRRTDAVGTVSWIERRGASLIIVLGAPAWSAAALATEVWTATGVAKPLPRSRR